jgi:WD40 repeat protein
MKMVAGSTKIFVSLALLLSRAPMLRSQGSPDILWKTNSHELSTVSSVQFSPDGATLATSAAESSGYPAKLWRLSDKTLVQTFSIPKDAIFRVIFSPDGTRLFGGGGDGYMRIWQVSDGQYLWAGGGQNDSVRGAAYSPDGSLLALGREDTWVTILNAPPEGNGGRLLGVHTDMVLSVAFSPDGTLLASGSQDATAILWRVSDGAVLRTFHHGYTVNAVSFSPSGQILATGAFDGTTRLWNITNDTVKVLNGGDTLALDFSPDGKLLLTASAGVLKLWRVSDATLLHIFDQEMEGAATSVDISPDGKLFAYGRGDGTVIVARMPLWIEQITRSGNEVTLRWQGGSGRYQLQACTNLNGDTWQNIGNPTTNTMATHSCVAPIFYRVQSLPSP